MGIQFGSAQVGGVYAGSTPVKAVYLGDTKIWPSALVWVGRLSGTVLSNTTNFGAIPVYGEKELPALVKSVEKIVFTSGSDVIVIPGDKVSRITPPDALTNTARVYLTTVFPDAAGTALLPEYLSKVEIYYKP